MKVLFKLSFIPYALVLVGGLAGAVFGVNCFFGRYYGVGGFLLGAIAVTAFLTAVIPVIPLCVVFHILCLFRKIVPFIKNINNEKFAIICAVICCATATAVFIRHHSFEIKQMLEKANAKQMSAAAEEKIAYNKNNIHVDGIFDMSGYKTNHIFIDYHKNKVGFLVSAGYDKYIEIRLTKTCTDSDKYVYITDTYFVQADIPLSAPGKRLVCFSKEKNRQYTSAMLLFYEDGTVFYADNICEKNNMFYTGLNFSEYDTCDGPVKFLEYEKTERNNKL